MDRELDTIINDEDLKAMHLLDYQFLSEDRSKFPSDAAALVYRFNKKVHWAVSVHQKRRQWGGHARTCV